MIYACTDERTIGIKENFTFSQNNSNIEYHGMSVLSETRCFMILFYKAKTANKNIDQKKWILRYKKKKFIIPIANQSSNKNLFMEI